MKTTQLLDLANEYGTPLYVYDLDVVKQQARRLLNSVDWPGRRVLYALKANYNPDILHVMQELGNGIDAVSPAEVHLALQSGFDAKEILFTSTNCSDADLREVSGLGVLCNLDSPSTVRRYARLFPGTELCLRVNPEVKAGSHRSVQTAGAHVKFGILAEDLDEVVAVTRRAGISIVGIHEHTGSGILDSEDYVKGAENLLKLISQERFPDLRFIDFGGGFGIPYHPEEQELPIDLLGSRLVAMFRNICTGYGRGLELWMEPGKYLVAQCGTLLAQVTTLRDNRGKRIAGVNSGFNHLIRPVLYGAYHHIVNLSNPSGTPQTYDIVGNVCESGDYFAEERVVPELHEGDIIGLQTAGAYGSSMASGYNLRPLPAEVSLENGNVRGHIPRESNLELASQRVWQPI